MDARILRLEAVREHVGLSRSSIYREVQAGRLTRPVHVSQAAVGWPAREIDAICEARISGLSDEQIKALVRELEAARGREAA